MTFTGNNVHGHYYIFNEYIRFPLLEIKWPNFYPLYCHASVANPLINFNGPLVLSLLMGAYPMKSYP